MKKIIQRYHILFVFLFAWFLFASCHVDECILCVPPDDTQEPKYKTKNVIILVIDGPRYSETWGDPSHQYIPRTANNMAPLGTICTNFYNDGITHTTAGHTALTTGFYQEIDNTGQQIPQRPSVFQYHLKKTQAPSTSAYIITSKDKLEVLADCTEPGFSLRYKPAADCGTAGLGSSYREDSITFNQAKNLLIQYHPRLVLIQFKEPDTQGHGNNWNGYLQGILTTDEYLWQLWSFLQNDPFYAGNTTLFVTNDHGRHLDNVADGFVSHGDSCEGCRHINLFAAGPDFKKGMIVNNRYNQVDIPVTIAELMGFSLKGSGGKVLWEFFDKQ